MAASTKDFVEAVIRVSGICQGESPLGSSAIRFTGEASMVGSDLPNLIARRFTVADMAEGDDTWVLALTTTSPVTMGGDTVTNPAGDAVQSLFDPEFVYIRTSAACTVDGFNAFSDSILPTFLAQGAVFVLSIPESQAVGLATFGVTFTWQQSDATAYEAATGHAFYLDLIVSARGL